MKKARHADDFTKYDEALFARAVITYHDNKIFDDPIDEVVLGKAVERWDKIYEVGAGLIALRNLADRELDRLRSEKDGLRRLGVSGLRQAIGLLDALTTGRRHAIFDLVKGLQSKAFRPGRVPPNVIEQMDINNLVGLLRALKITGQKESAAIEQIVRVCKLKPADQWRRRIRDWNRRSKDRAADKVAATLACDPAERILERAARWAAQAFAIPPAPISKGTPV